MNVAVTKDQADVCSFSRTGLSQSISGNGPSHGCSSISSISRGRLLLSVGNNTCTGREQGCVGMRIGGKQATTVYVERLRLGRDGHMMSGD